MSTYSDWDQRQLDIQSGLEMDRRRRLVDVLVEDVLATSDQKMLAEDREDRIAACVAAAQRARAMANVHRRAEREWGPRYAETFRTARIDAYARAHDYLMQARRIKGRCQLKATMHYLNNCEN